MTATDVACVTPPAATYGPSSFTTAFPGKSLLHLMISLCPACHAKIHRTKVAIRLMPPLLLLLWREVHPNAHEQTALNFNPPRPPVKPATLFQCPELPADLGETVVIYNYGMATSVKLRTAVPSVAEFGKSLGISEKRQKAIISTVKRDSAAGQFRMSRKGNASVSEAAGSEKVSRAAKR